jgi:hypothetical protein
LKLLGTTDIPELVDLNQFNGTLDEISEWRTQPHFHDIELLGKDSAEKSKSKWSYSGKKSQLTELYSTEICSNRSKLAYYSHQSTAKGSSETLRCQTKMAAFAPEYSHHAEKQVV